MSDTNIRDLQVLYLQLSKNIDEINSIVIKKISKLIGTTKVEPSDILLDYDELLLYIKTELRLLLWHLTRKVMQPYDVSFEYDEAVRQKNIEYHKLQLQLLIKKLNKQFGIINPIKDIPSWYFTAINK